MSSAPAHRAAAVVAGLVTSFVNSGPEEERVEMVGWFTAASLIGAKLPEILEPALHPNHRAFFHSFLVFGGAALAVKALWDWKPESLNERRLRAALLGALVGYCSHLGLDAFTSKSLPLIGPV